MNRIFAALLGILMIFNLSIAQADNFSSLGQTMDDGVITTKILGKYVQDPNLSPLKIGVSTSNGMVVISGSVNTDEDFKQAIMLAQSVDGVKNVNAEQLKIMSGSDPVTDMLITAQVKGILLRENTFNNIDVKFWTVNVNTQDGIVTLSGTVENDVQKSNIENIAAKVSGVKGIKNNLLISSQ